MAVNWLEIAAAALGIVNIVLLVRRSIWNFPFALAMVGLYAGIFYEQRLYSDALLQIFFFALNIYGWWNWRHGTDAGRPIEVERLSWAQRGSWLALASGATIAWGTAMARLTDAAFPYLDGAVAMFSVTAQILLARRYIENWLLWIGVDVLAIGIYLSKHLVATAGLYAVMLVLCFVGLAEWRRSTPGDTAVAA